MAGRGIDGDHRGRTGGIRLDQPPLHAAVTARRKGGIMEEREIKHVRAIQVACTLRAAREAGEGGL